MAGRGVSWSLRLGLAALACLLVGGLAWQGFYALGLRHLQEANTQRLAFYAASLESALDKHEPLPHLAGLERDITAALLNPEDANRIAAANRYLKMARDSSRVAAIYLMDTRGLTIAASNWAGPQSFVGQRYTFRPYFREAMAGGVGRIYAVGATTREPGYFIAAPVRRNGAEGSILGVVAVKVSLEDFEQDLARSGERLAVADAAGVLFLSPQEGWKFHTLRPLSPDHALSLAETRQYGDHSLTALIPGEVLDADLPTQSVRLGGPVSGPHLLLAQPVGRLNWRMLLFAPLGEVRQTALAQAAAVAFAFAFVMTLLGFWHQRRQGRSERLAAARELERVHAALEQRIGERTADLENKLADLRGTEAILRQTRDDAVQAGKLAVLGQLSAGITHEINQPLAALTTLSANAAKFLERGDIQEVRDNLTLIEEMAQRLGRIVAQFKAFARKAPAELTAVDVGEAVRTAAMIVEGRRRETAAGISLSIPNELPRVRADAVRLEQVLVNLMKNGLEAAAATVGTEPRLSLSARFAEGRVVLVLADNGPGISPEALPHLFEPFYSTKSASEGLGLGLAISRAIVEGFGGSLTAHNREEGGAEFVIILDSI